MKENKLGKYLLYAVGEIVLVVIGILIALQINNANQRKIEEVSLEGHLQSISKNIESDLKKARNIFTKRRDLLSKKTFISQNITPRVMKSPYAITNLKSTTYSKEDVVFTSKVLEDVWDLNYLNPNTSGFESLKNSGYLSKLQGKDIGDLLSEYYNLINQINFEEVSHNDRIQSALIEFSKSDLEGSRLLFSPDFVNWSADNLDSFRPLMLGILSDANIKSSLAFRYDIQVDYENLIVMGDEIIGLVNQNAFDFDQTKQALRKQIFDKFDGSGHAKIIVNGYINPYHSFLEAYSSPIGQNTGHSILYQEFNMNFPAMAWSVLYFYVGQGSIEQIVTRDYSNYNTLRLELKGAKGGEKIMVSIKDESNPTDGTEAKVPLTLTNDWKVYDIPLSEFSGTNLKKLFMPASIVVENDAVSIGIKNIEYTK
jgi:hypothetical protein